jgi:hypothetical protein
MDVGTISICMEATMRPTEGFNEPATPEQLELLRQLGVRVRIQISRALAQISIEFHQATRSQLHYLHYLGYEIDRPITKRQASDLIQKRLKERGDRSWCTP